MCDENTEQENQEYLLKRREFGKLGVSIGLSVGVAAGMAALIPDSANAMDITESDVDVTMANGISDCYFVRPSIGKHPAVLMWPDIKGLRTAYKAMGKRLAEAGYAVLVVNQFYRDAKAPVVGPEASFSDPDTRAYLIGMARKLGESNAISDAKAYISFLDQQDGVDITRKMGTAGYCMGGPLIMRTAAAAPNRVGAAASFHGGGMATDKTDSPHLLIPKSPAHVLHAIAENDDAKNPQMKEVLAAAYKAAGVPAEITVYKDTMHGWCALDSTVYHKAQAELAWARMLALFERALV
ncbi:MAG: dienelactone hydrolase family protein [Pseudomonadales bacterium]